MIILRYITREILQTTLAVTSVLLVIIMSGRFVKYLADAASGKLDASVLFAIMYYRLPGFLELIVPLGFFIALLLVYGRMYTEHEMTVLSSCGLSRKQIIAYTYVPAGIVMATVASLSLWLSPVGLQKAEQVLAQQQARSDFETIQPARFQALSKKNLISYAEGISADKQQLSTFFLANVGVSADEGLMVVRAQTAERIDDASVDERYLLLRKGVRYEGRPGEANYRVTEFDTFAQHLSPPETIDVVGDQVNRLATMDLLSSSQPDYQAEFQWRFSSLLLVFIVTLLGVVLSYTSPRRGRYVMLFPAILLYLVYLVLLNAARGAIEEQTLSATIGLWGVHLGFLCLSLILLIDKSFWRRLWSRPPAQVSMTGNGGAT